jgi:hypothetical protein
MYAKTRPPILKKKTDTSITQSESNPVFVEETSKESIKPSHKKPRRPKLKKIESTKVETTPAPASPKAIEELEDSAGSVAYINTAKEDSAFTTEEENYSGVIEYETLHGVEENLDQLEPLTEPEVLFFEEVFTNSEEIETQENENSDVSQETSVEELNTDSLTADSLTVDFVEQRQNLKENTVKQLSRRQKRKLKKLNRTVQDKATRTTWRTLFFALLPSIGFAITYYFYSNGEPIEKILISLGVAVAFLLFTGPFILWGAISSLRRGTRRFLLSMILGFYSGFLTVGLAVAIVGALFGYTLLFNEPIPYTDYKITLPGGIK